MLIDRESAGRAVKHPHPGLPPKPEERILEEGVFYEVTPQPFYRSISRHCVVRTYEWPRSYP
jgi:hypothetical protein